MKVIEVYHCDYCKKYSISKGVITRHEKECYHNPTTRACATCSSFYQEEFKRPFFGGTATHLRPMCGVGIQLYNEAENELGYKANLCHNCDMWKPKSEEVKS